MKKTTLYLPDRLKKQIETAARREGRSEADVIRDALATAMEARHRPAPRIPLVRRALGDSTIAQRADELLELFGR